MKALMALVFIPSVLIFTGCAKSKTEPEESCGFVTDDNGQRVSWNERVPVSLYLHRSFPQKYKSAVIDSMKVWEESLGRVIFVLQEEVIDGEPKPVRDGRSVIYWLSDWERGRETEQGRTDLYSREFEILEADVRINGTAKSFKFYLDEPSSAYDFSLKSLLVHELGHVLGLAHHESANSVMKAHLAPHEERAHVGGEDVEHLQCEY